MRFSSRTLTLLVALVGTALLGAFLPTRAEGEASSVNTGSSRAAPDATIERIRITETRKGERLWEVEADKGEIFEDRGIAILTQVATPVRIVIHNGEESLTTFAERAVVNLTTKDLQLSGHVRSESSEGMQFFGERLTWSAKKRQIRSNAPVVIKKPGLEIQGKGMVADTVLERMTIREPITTLTTVSGQQEKGR
ncbi:MAG: LPS export ABC transporter periplasmic protein LptC [Candidatus Methylomirabilales bacterium]